MMISNGRTDLDSVYSLVSKFYRLGGEDDVGVERPADELLNFLIVFGGAKLLLNQFWDSF